MESKVSLSISHFSQSKNRSTISDLNAAFTCPCLCPLKTEALNSHLQQIEGYLLVRVKKGGDLTVSFTNSSYRVAYLHILSLQQLSNSIGQQILVKFPILI